ncbi:spore germination protein [Paenibacillus puerhi]|uniref:spore germination protein n=1 Tax=Paenibacillus puerhi TaxID=2692622 RepID=UPI00135A42E4|nr:spore germination protein [Paenibacillus puerhi]
MDQGVQLLEQVKAKLTGCADIIYQPLQVGAYSCLLIYIGSIVSKQTLREAIIKPLLEEGRREQSDQQLAERIVKEEFFPIPSTRMRTADELGDAIVSGYAALYWYGQSEMRVFGLVDYQRRAIPDSTNEMVTVGPQEAFIEDLEVNLSLLRHRIKHTDMKIQEFLLGTYTKSRIFAIHIEGICKPEILKQVIQSLEEMNMDSNFGVSSLGECLVRSSYSPLPQYQFTERPDTAAAALLEGRVVILQDGNPFSLVVPVTFFSLLQSAEDYYQSAASASWIRLVRLLFSVFSLLLPSLYVAITTFHPEIIPTALLITIAAARENIPFTAVVEALIMEITFEGLREAGIRIPKPLGQTVSIIGGIVIGQAAVQAGIVSAPLVIVVSITGIASFIIPHYELGLAFRLLRFPLLLIGGTLGLIGILVSMFLIYMYMVNLRSFGIPYMQPLAPFVWKDIKDTFIRAPWFLMKTRPASYAKDNMKRQGPRWQR